MKKGLWSALIKTYRKYAVLFFAFIIFFLFVGGARAESAPIPNEQNGKVITVRASVSLTPEFVYSIQKNSSLELEKAAFALGEEVNVRVKIVSANNFPLRGHKINLQSVSAGEEISFVISGETDNDGFIHFSFSADKRLLGKNTLRVVDVTYDEPITILQERFFIVYKPADSQREKELLEQKIIIRKSDVSKQVSFGETQRLLDDGNIRQNNGTIKISFKKKLDKKWNGDP